MRLGTFWNGHVLGTFWNKTVTNKTLFETKLKKFNNNLKLDSCFATVYTNRLS